MSADSADRPRLVQDSPDVRGVLHVSRIGDRVGSRQPLRHLSRFVNGPHYQGATDNDLRGFLDGGFAWGWNQATQTHVRLGRVGGHRKPRHGEEELFRVAQRWEGVKLPHDATVHRVRLVLVVEAPPPRRLRVLLYAVHKEWGPGAGGVNRNNVSVPAEGEVWWNAAAHGEEQWGLPGAGYASDDGTGADTGASPLAEAVVGPEGGPLIFASPRLTEYVGQRATRGEPLRFLVKLPDLQEDTPGSFLSLYSAKHGDRMTESRRPLLEVEWDSPREASRREETIHLEQGRTLVFPRMAAVGETWAISFLPEPGSLRPTVERRWGRGDWASEWLGGSILDEADAEWVQIRLRAHVNPVALGTPFTTELVDTWVLAGPPEAQEVAFTFTSPTGVSHRRLADYGGQWRWKVEFVPDEVGPWGYRWSHSFSEAPFESPAGRFDVYGADMQSVVGHLSALAEAVSTSGADRLLAQRKMLALEREGMRLLTPASFRAEPGESLRRALREVRSAIAGRGVPNPMPMVSHELVTEVDGQTLTEPFPSGASYGIPAGPVTDGTGPAKGRGSSRTDRIRRILARFVGRR